MATQSERSDDEYSETFESFNPLSDIQTHQSESQNVRPLSALSSRRSSFVESNSIVQKSRRRSGELGTARTLSTARSYSSSFCSTVSESAQILSQSLHFSRHFNVRPAIRDVSKAGSEFYSETFDSIDGSDFNNSPFATDSEPEKEELELDDRTSSSKTSTNSRSSHAASFGNPLPLTDSVLEQRKHLHSDSDNSNSDNRNYSSAASEDTTEPGDLITSFLYYDPADLVPVIEDHQSTVTSSTMKKREENNENNFDGEFGQRQLNAYIQAKVSMLRRKASGQHATSVSNVGMHDPDRKQSSLVDADEDMVSFMKSKLKLTRRRVDHIESDHTEFFLRERCGQRVGDRFSCSVVEYGISPSVLGRLKLQRTLERLDKICDLHEGTACHSCREEKDLVAFKDFLVSKRALVLEKLTTERLDSELLLRDPLTMAGEMARYVTYLGKHPELVLQELLKPLRTTPNR